jgi:hypothetical protein
MVFTTNKAHKRRGTVLVLHEDNLAEGPSSTASSIEGASSSSDGPSIRSRHVPDTSYRTTTVLSEFLETPLRFSGNHRWRTSARQPGASESLH